MNYIVPLTGREWRNEYPGTFYPSGQFYQSSQANLSCVVVDSTRHFLREKRCTVKTSEENDRIKRKLAEYEAMFKKRYAFLFRKIDEKMNNSAKRFRTANLKDILVN